MNENPVRWFEIYVDDLPRAKAFYERVLATQLKELEAPGPGVSAMWAFPMREGGSGAAGALVKMQGFEAGAGGTIVYFECDDCAVEAGRVAANGGKVKKEKFALGNYGFIALIQDPGGNLVGLHSRK